MMGFEFYFVILTYSLTFKTFIRIGLVLLLKEELPFIYIRRSFMSLCSHNFWMICSKSSIQKYCISNLKFEDKWNSITWTGVLKLKSIITLKYMKWALQSPTYSQPFPPPDLSTTLISTFTKKIPWIFCFHASCFILMRSVSRSFS